MNVLALFGVICLSIIVHELTHLVMFRLLGKLDIEIRLSRRGIITGHTKDYYQLNPEKRITQNITAMILGVFPLFLINNGFLLLLCVGFYCVGCSGDYSCIVDDLKKMGAIK